MHDATGNKKIKLIKPFHSLSHLRAFEFAFYLNIFFNDVLYILYVRMSVSYLTLMKGLPPKGLSVFVTVFPAL